MASDVRAGAWDTLAPDLTAAASFVTADFEDAGGFEFDPGFPDTDVVKTPRLMSTYKKIPSDLHYPMQTASADSHHCGRAPQAHLEDTALFLYCQIQ